MLPSLTISLLDWVGAQVNFDQHYPEDADRMRLAIALARESVARDSGGPFGVAIFEQNSGG